MEKFIDARRFIFLNGGIREGTERHDSFFRAPPTSWRGWLISRGAPGATTSAYHRTGKHNKHSLGHVVRIIKKNKKKIYYFKYSELVSRQTEELERP